MKHGTARHMTRAQITGDRLPEMTEDGQYTLLASDGMAVKRPI